MPMIKLSLQRVVNTPDGMFGVLLDEHFPVCVTLENPWLENQTFVSCIPAGNYICKPFSSDQHGETWEVTKVKGRTAILFHVGNTEDETEGCILLGTAFGALDVPAVLHSKNAFELLTAIVDGETEFMLTVLAHNPAL